MSFYFWIRQLFINLTVLRDNAIYDFSKKAVENGLDIFRVFDSLNYFGMNSFL
jgi:pyruvate carboxylase